MLKVRARNGTDSKIRIDACLLNATAARAANPVLKTVNAISRLLSRSTISDLIVAISAINPSLLMNPDSV
jgi:hypothetical protein